MFILPLELVMWAVAMDHTMEVTFLSRRVLMSPLFELSANTLRFVAAFGLLAGTQRFPDHVQTESAMP